MSFSLCLGRSKSVVGLDIGTSQIKLVELVKRGSALELRRVAMAPAPITAIRNGMVIEPEQVAEAISAALAAGHVKPGNVVLAVAGQGVVVRHVRLPRMPAEEVREALRWEGEKHIPYPIAEAVYDYEIIDERAGSDSSTMEVMLVAAPRELVDSHVKAIELAGLKPLAVDVQPFTVLRALRWRPEADGSAKPAGASTAYIDIGAGTTDIVVAQGDRLRFTRIVQTGGNTFTSAIAERVGASFEEAERIKIEEARVYGGDFDLGALDDRARLISEAVQDVASEIALEIRRSIDYHDVQLEADNRESAVGKVVLTGGGSALEGLDERIESELGLMTSRGDPFQYVDVNAKLASKYDLAKLGSMLAVSVGLALREVMDD